MNTIEKTGKHSYRVNEDAARLAVAEHAGRLLKEKDILYLINLGIWDDLQRETVQESIRRYESLADAGKAQASEAVAAFVKIKRDIARMGLEYNSETLTKLGGKRYAG